MPQLQTMPVGPGNDSFLSPIGGRNTLVLQQTDSGWRVLAGETNRDTLIVELLPETAEEHRACEEMRLTLHPGGGGVLPIGVSFQVRVEE